MAWGAFVASLLTVSGYFLLPSIDAQNVTYTAIGAASVIAILVGVRINRPTDRTAWYLLAGGAAASTVADFVENVVYGIVLHRPVPFPSLADAIYLASYPLTFLGLVRLCRSRDEAGSRENLVDAGVIALAALALSWHFVMSGDLHASGVHALGRAVLVAYPLMDVGLVFILLRALVFGSGRLTVHRLIGLSLAGTLVADFAYDYIVQNSGYSTGNPIDAGWLLNYLILGVAALHPSTADVAPARPFDPVAARRLPALALAGFVPPAIILVGRWAGAAVDVPVMAGISLLLFGLLALRMGWLFSSIREHTIRAQADAAALGEALHTRERLEFDLRHQAFHDPLTGLANRALLFERVEEAMRGGAGRRLVALCLCDLDGFKTVNDSLGHHAGDELLQVVAGRLSAIVRGGDLVARLGGDEFAVLLDGLASAERAYEVAERIVTSMREPIGIAGRQLNLSVSVGLAFGEGRRPGVELAKTTEQLLGEADVAMYEAKGKGKCRWETFEASMQSRSVERLELANAFRGSLERGEFRLAYQPQFSLGDGRLEGFEALVRWAHPTRGLVTPDKFIPLAEETGFIIPLGRWVLERACEQASSWAGTAAGLTMAVNLSGRQLQDPMLADDVRTALALSGLDASRLVLEVTETSLLADSEETVAVLAALKAVGVQLALDDFGTGYSSLSYLRRLPLDVLKIDKSFVDPLGADGSQEEALVSTIIDFARIVGLRTVAEGVENVAQHEQLARLGCASCQGFLLSPPLDPEAAASLVGRAADLVHGS